MSAGLDSSVLVAALTGSSIFTTMLPPLSEVRRASVDSATARDVHAGIAAASASLVGVGLVIAMAERSGKPILLTLALAGLMGAVYEGVLRQESAGQTSPESVPEPRRGWRG